MLFHIDFSVLYYKTEHVIKYGELKGMDYSNYCFKITLQEGTVISPDKSNTTFKGCLLDKNSKQNKL